MEAAIKRGFNIGTIRDTGSVKRELLSKASLVEGVAGVRVRVRVRVHAAVLTLHSAATPVPVVAPAFCRAGFFCERRFARDAHNGPAAGAAVRGRNPSRAAAQVSVFCPSTSAAGDGSGSRQPSRLVAAEPVNQTPTPRPGCSAVQCGCRRPIPAGWASRWRRRGGVRRALRGAAAVPVRASGRRGGGACGCFCVDYPKCYGCPACQGHRRVLRGRRTPDRRRGCSSASKLPP